MLHQFKKILPFFMGSFLYLSPLSGMSIAIEREKSTVEFQSQSQTIPHEKTAVQKIITSILPIVHAKRYREVERDADLDIGCDFERNIDSGTTFVCDQYREHNLAEISQERVEDKAI